jgi:hypothetical protein
MRHIVVEAWKDTVARIEADLREMPLSRWNESVLRFFYSRALTERAPDVRQEFECGRIDLVLCRNCRKRKLVYVEFKFYVHARHDPLICGKENRKGGPGQGNFKEFEKAIETLRKRSVPPGVLKVLKIVALFYCDPASTASKTTYDRWFGDRSKVESKLRKRIRPLCSIRPFRLRCNGSESVCHARLWEVCA